MTKDESGQVLTGADWDGRGVVLGIDTSAQVCVGIAADSRVLASAVVPDSRAHVEQLMPLTRQVMAEAGIGFDQLDGIAVGVGPGPFTGLRVGVVAALTLAEVCGIGVRGVCSLDVIARQVVTAGPLDSEFVVASDARRKEWYWARYGADGTRSDGPFVTVPTELPDVPHFGPVSGTAMTLDAGQLAAVCADLPDAGLVPLYLRRPDAEVPTSVKSTLLPPRLALGRRR